MAELDLDRPVPTLQRRGNGGPAAIFEKNLGQLGASVQRVAQERREVARALHGALTTAGPCFLGHQPLWHVRIAETDETYPAQHRSLFR